MKKVEKWFLWFVLAFNVFVISVNVIDHIAFQIIVWFNMDHAVSWQILKVAQLLTIPVSVGSFFISLLFRMRKIDLTALLPKEMIEKIRSIIYLDVFIIYILGIASAAHLKYVGYIGDEYELARAHTFFLYKNYFFVTLTEANIGVLNLLKREHVTEDGSD